MRKLFGTDGIRGKANTYPITAEMALKVGKAVAKVFKNGKKPKIVIGKDTRISGYMLETALTAGIVSEGADVLLVGPLPTPAIAHLIKSFAADAGIVISASHNPAEDNGIKIFDKEGFKLDDKVEEKIEKLLNAKDDGKHKEIGKAYRIEDARGRYIEYIKGTIKNKSLKGLKIVLDCANGAAYNTAPHIFKELGANVTVINDKPDGLNINKNCGAVYPESLKKIVLKEKASIGIALDGDADRVVALDEKGNIIDGDHLMAILALELKTKKLLNKDTVVVTEMSNIGFYKAMKKNGINVVTTQVGDRYVIEVMKKHDYSIGGEQSGHINFIKHLTTGDGTLAALQVCHIMAKKNKKLSELAKVMDQYPQVLINIHVTEKKPLEKIKGYKELAAKVEKELGSDGRLLVRYSGTQKVCRVMVEAKTSKDANANAKKIADVIKKQIGA